MEIEKLSSGEKIAYIQGKDLLTESQLCICHIAALARVKGINIEDLGIKSNNELYVEAGINPETFRRTVNKFELILEDKHQDEEYTKSEHIYPKILNGYNKFIEMKRNDLVKLGQECFTEENRKIGLALKDAHDIKTKKYSEIKKNVDEKIRFQLINLFNSFKRIGFDYNKAKSNAISKTSKEFEKDKLEVTRIWNLLKM